MQGREVHLLRVDQFIVGRSTEIINILDQECIIWFMAGQENNLSSPRRKILDNGCTYAGSAALDVTCGQLKRKFS